MQLSAVILARVVYFVESVDLNPKGAAYYPDIITAFVNRYGFQKYPQKPEDFDEQKGVALSQGKFENKTIEQATIYNWGVTLETRSSTEDAEELLEDALVWGAKSLRLHFTPDMIKRKSYVSQLTFYSDARMLLLNPFLSTVAQKISDEVTTNLKLKYQFQPTGVIIGVDPESQKIPVQVFTVERRVGVAFSEGKYFSAAPVPTTIHLRLLEEFERTILVDKKP